MTHTPQIILAPAILADTLDGYKKQAQELSSFSSVIHIDVMDGIYVPMTSPTLEDIVSVLPKKNILYSVHLMVEKPEELLSFIHKIDSIKVVYVHIEKLTVTMLRTQYPFAIVPVINPETVIEKYQELIMEAGDVQIMTVHPGKQGAVFLPEALEKIHVLDDMGFGGDIHIDGSVNKNTIEEILSYEPSVLTVGSAISKSRSPKDAFMELLDFIS